jgi:hypothetical protein
MRFCKFCKREIFNKITDFCNFDCETNHEINRKSGVSLLAASYFDRYRSYK